MARRHAFLAALLAAFTLAGCGRAGASPSGPAETPSPTPVQWATFASERHGYAIDHPSEWRVLEKVGTTAVEILRPFNPGADVIMSEEAHKWQTREGLQVAAVPVDAAVTLDDFTASVHMPCGGPSKHEEIKVGGEPAAYRQFRCNSNRPVYLQVTVLHGGRGYVVWLMTSERPHADDRPEYQSMIDSFEFTDAAAAVRGD